MYGNSLSNLNNLAGAIHNVKCKYWHNDEKCETYGIKYKNCECFFQYINFKDNLIEQKSLCCNNAATKKFYENVKKLFFSS